MHAGSRAFPLGSCTGWAWDFSRYRRPSTVAFLRAFSLAAPPYETWAGCSSSAGSCRASVWRGPDRDLPGVRGLPGPDREQWRGQSAIEEIKSVVFSPVWEQVAVGALNIREEHPWNVEHSCSGSWVVWQSHPPSSLPHPPLRRLLCRRRCLQPLSLCPRWHPPQPPSKPIWRPIGPKLPSVVLDGVHGEWDERRGVVRGELREPCGGRGGDAPPGVLNEPLPA